MANLNVTCPHCQTTLEAPDTMLGSETQCPVCGKSFVVTDQSVPPAEPVSKGAIPQPKKAVSPIVLYCALGVSLLLSITSLCLALFSSGFPKMSFETTPEKAVRSFLKFRLKAEATTNYFWRKNGSAILNTLDIKETKENGNWAVVFFKMSLGTTEYRDAMMLQKTKDGYWVQVSLYTAKRKCPENWYREMEAKIDRFKKDSVDFDTSDI